MTMQTKDNLSQIFRQHDLRSNADQITHTELTSVLKPLSLRPALVTSPFVVNNPFALQIDEII